MFIASLSENKEIEKRLAVTPEITKKYIDLGLDLLLPKNYGSHLGFDDSEYKSLGANFFDSDEKIINEADIIIQLGMLEEKKLSLLKENQTLIGSLDSFSNSLIVLPLPSILKCK